MTKFAPDTTMDQMLTYIQSNCSHIHICSTQPTTYAHANASYSLGSKAHTITSTSNPSDYASGRVLAVGAATSITMGSSGSMQHVALTKSSGSVLLYVTTIAASSVTSVNASDKVNTSAFNINLADPS
jgi:hypothetical protein